MSDDRNAAGAVLWVEVMLNPPIVDGSCIMRKARCMSSGGVCAGLPLYRCVIMFLSRRYSKFASMSVMCVGGVTLQW